jgi:hypothetical protein
MFIVYNLIHYIHFFILQYVSAHLPSSDHFTCIVAELLLSSLTVVYKFKSKCIAWLLAELFRI